MYISLEKNPATHGDTISVWAGDVPSGSHYISWNFGANTNPASYQCFNYGSSPITITIRATVTDINGEQLTGGTAQATLTINPTPPPPPDTTGPTFTIAPTIGLIDGYNSYSVGYRVTCVVSDQSGIQQVLFPTWTDADGQDDIIWGVGTHVGSGYYYYDVYKSAHGNQSGQYQTHVYAYDNSTSHYVTAMASAGCNVPVAYVSVTGIAVNPTSAIVTNGVPISLASYVSVVPSNANNQGLFWSVPFPHYITSEGVLTAGASGSFYITIYTQEGSFYGSIAITSTDSGSSRPPDWVWSSNIASGSNAYNAIIIDETIKVYIMPASEWNSFCARINEFRTYKGLGNYSFTSASPEADFTYAFINQAASAINAMGFAISGVSQGQDIAASIFITLRNALNSII